MTIESLQKIYAGRVIQLNIERVRLPNGAVADLEIVHHPGGAAVVALDAERRVCLLRQYRHAAGGWLWELPAGKIEHGEPPLTTAQRELQEEAGVSATQWRSLGDYYSSPGVLTEVVRLFLAFELSALPVRPEAHEVFEVHWLPFDAAYEMAGKGELCDGKSVVGVFRAAALLRAAAPQG
ncbi:MAG TPA: NUDIX hydrolase [Steroidobacter sp.]|jgi:ADP-ribose pyrophosphatase|nr:NUDIX hydrolase [Steroidobacter sp.]